MSESAISSLVGRRLLRPRLVVQWFLAEGHKRPYERVAETVMFKAIVERGLGYGWAFGLPKNFGSGISGFQKY